MMLWELLPSAIVIWHFRHIPSTSLGCFCPKLFSPKHAILAESSSETEDVCSENTDDRPVQPVDIPTFFYNDIHKYDTPDCSHASASRSFRQTLDSYFHHADSDAADSIPTPRDGFDGHRSAVAASAGRSPRSDATSSVSRPTSTDIAPAASAYSVLPAAAARPPPQGLNAPLLSS